MPAQNCGASGQRSDDLLYHRAGRCRKQPQARFTGGAVPPSSPPHPPQQPPHPPQEEHQHASQQQQIEENPEAGARNLVVCAKFAHQCILHWCANLVDLRVHEGAREMLCLSNSQKLLVIERCFLLTDGVLQLPPTDSYF